MNKTITFKTSVYSGDLIATLPGIRQVCRKQNAKAEIFLWLNRSGFSYEGAEHPYQGKMLTEYAYKMLKPLLEEQDYIMHVRPWNGEEILVDLDELRQAHVGMPYGSIHRWPFYLWADMTCDLSKPWLHVDPAFMVDDKVFDKVIINRTSRYHNGYINYFFLRQHQQHLVFAGLKEEHEAFCKEWELDIPYLEVNDFLHLAIALKSCKFFMGNQSTCFGIAEGLKIPRMLEVCQFAPNVIPCGENAYDYIGQGKMEFIFNELMRL